MSSIRAVRIEPDGILDTPCAGYDGDHLAARRAGQRTTELFDNLSEKLGGILDRLTRRGSLTEADVDAAMREVRRALLEADVSLDVVRSFTEKVREQAIGATVVKSVTPGQMVVKIVHDELVATLGSDGQTIDLNAVPPVAIMMVGLQGSGKTTTTAKLARRLTQRDKRKVLMASLDIYRPAAMEQLAVLGRDLDIPTLPIVAGQKPAQIAKRALEAGKLGGYDVVLLDTAGRTTLDEEMMAEAAEIKTTANPHEVLLVADSLTGQDAVNLARSFDAARRAHRHRADTGGRRRPRRCGAVDARGHRQADQADRHRRKNRRAGRFSSQPDRGPHSRHGRRGVAGGKSRRPYRCGKGRARRREDAQGPVRPFRHARAASADVEHGRHQRPDGHDARHRENEEPARRRQSRRQGVEAPGRGDRFDDAAGAQESGHPQGQPQEAHRRRRRPQGRGSQQAAQDAPEHGRHDEGDGFGQARADGRHRAGDGLWWRRHAVTGADEGAGGKNAWRCRRRAACPHCRRICLPACAQACRTCRG